MGVNIWVMTTFKLLDKIKKMIYINFSTFCQIKLVFLDLKHI